MGEFIRTFIAIDPDDKSRDKILSFIERAHSAIKGYVSWIKRDNLHFTLKFLGEISPEKIEDVTNLLNNLSLAHRSFKVTISKTGFFPDIKRPRIFWAGVKEGKEDIIRLVNDIESDCEYLGFEREKREFKAHITLARIKDPHIKIDPKILEEISRDEICNFIVDKITLYRSDLLPEGAKYSIIKELQLR